MKSLSGVFANLEAAERACRQLEAHGISRSQLSLIFDEACPACAVERDRESQVSSESLPIGQGFGALLGIAVGIAAVFWPLNGFMGAEGVPPDPMALSPFDWMLRLFIVASWSLSGAILGGMLAAAVSDTWATLKGRDAELPLHSHYILSIDSPLAGDEEVRSIVQKRGGRLIETPAPSRMP